MIKQIIICANLIEKHGKFLIVKETKKIAKNLYNIPGGKLEKNETLLECAIREAKEETGLIVEPSKLIKIFQLPKAKSGNNLIIIAFKSEIISGKLITSKEHPEIKFLSLKEIKRLNKLKQLRYGLANLSVIEDYLNNKSFDLNFLRIFEKN